MNGEYYKIYMRKLLIVNIFILLFGCSQEKSKVNVVGFYKTSQNEWMVWKNKKFFEKSGTKAFSQLQLNSDSTFSYETCGNKMTGHWKVKGDSLVLKIEKNNLKMKKGDERNAENGFLKSYKIEGLIL